MKFPKISLNIPVLTKENTHIVLETIKKIDYPSNKFEVIIIKGNHIAKQRNRGVKYSKGEIIYLLDNDSQIQKNSLKIIARAFINPRIAAVGGPSLTPKNQGYFNQLVGYVLETYFGAFRMRHKWSKLKQNSSIDYYFIGANLALRKKLVLKVGGFDENIVPNEETELLRRLKQKGYIIQFNEKLFIFRNQRKNLYLLAKQFHHYGKGRMKQIKKQPIFDDIVFVAPIFFVFYIISLFFFHPIWYLLPLFIYTILGCLTSFNAAIKYKKPSVFLAMLFLFPTIHFSYAFGLMEEHAQTWIPEILRTKIKKPKKIIIKKPIVFKKFYDNSFPVHK